MSRMDLIAATLIAMNPEMLRLAPQSEEREDAPKELTKFDLERIEKAKQKRLRKLTKGKQ